MNKRLAVAFKGQLYKNDASSANYVYPSNATEWALSLSSDPRKLISDLGVSGDFCCYTIKATPHGIVYAYRRSLSGRNGSNYAMVMMLVDGHTCDGQRLTTVLNELLDYALLQSSSDQINEKVLNEKLSACKDLFHSYRMPQLPLSSNDNNDKAIPLPEAYRVYNNNDELYDMLQNPYQAEYKNYYSIHLVSKQYEVNRNAATRLISTPLQKAYFFELPNGDVKVNDNKTYVNQNETFTLTYSRDGYDDYKTDILKMASKSSYFIVNGDTIVVKTANECKIPFKRKITLHVVDNLGNPITDWQFKSGRDGWKMVQDSSKEWHTEDGEYQLKIRKDGFMERDFNLDTTRKQSFSCALEPKGFSKKVFLLPAWPREKTRKPHNEEPVTMNYAANNSLYVRYQKLLDPGWNNIPTLYVVRHRPLPLLITIAVAMILLGIGATLAIGRHNYPIEPPIQEDTTSVKKEETKIVKKAIDVPEYVKVEHDECYLNYNNLWLLDSLQSKKYQYFFDSVLSNKSLFSNVDFKEYDSISNKYWMIVKDAIYKGNHGSWVTYNSLQFKNQAQAIKDGKQKEMDLVKAVTPVSNNSNTTNSTSNSSHTEPNG